MDGRIIERYRRPLHKGFREDARYTVAASGTSPLCGDAIEMRLRVVMGADGSGVVADAAFDGYACSLCTAAADLLAERLPGMTVRELLSLDEADMRALLGGVRVERSRAACVRLPLSAAQAACGASSARRGVADERLVVSRAADARADADATRPVAAGVAL